LLKAGLIDEATNLLAESQHALVEAYVQQLVELGHPEDIARAHAIAHYSNLNEQQN